MSVMSESKIVDGDAVQQISGVQEGVLLNTGVIELADENIGVLHYRLAEGKTWADVDAVIDAMNCERKAAQ